MAKCLVLIFVLQGVPMLSCEFSLSELIVDNILRYNCTIQHPSEFRAIPKDAIALRLAFSPNHDIDFHNWPIPQLSQLDMLEIDVSFVPQPIPGGMFSQLRRLDKLTIYHHLHTSAGFLAELDSGLFRGFFRLTTLNLPSVGLDRLPVEVFDGLTKLRTLDLNQNRLTTLPPNIFSTCCEEMVLLNMGKNRLLATPSAAIRKLTSLRQLNLYGNNITKIPSFAFPGLTNLTELSLDRNQLRSVERNAFGGLQNLRKLYMDGNLLSNVSKEMFFDLSTLLLLDLSENRISELSRGQFSPLKLLKELSLRANGIVFVEPGAFEGLEELQALDLQDNLISIVNGSMFKDLRNLRGLNLGGNRISVISLDAFISITQLFEINLSKNALTSLPEGVFNNTNNVRLLLDISENPWLCDCDCVRQMKDLKDRLDIQLENQLMTSCASPPHIKNESPFGLRTTSLGSNGSSCFVISLPAEATTLLPVTTDVPNSSVTSCADETVDLETERTIVVIVTCGLICVVVIATFALFVWIRCKHRITWNLGRSRRPS